MSLSLYMDENVHRAITGGLRLRGVDVLTVQEDGRRGWTIPGFWIVRQSSVAPFSPRARVCWRKRGGGSSQGFHFPESSTHQLHTTIGDCVLDLELVAKASHPEELSNRILFLPL